jgi:hypothetical protein
MTKLQNWVVPACLTIWIVLCGAAKPPTITQQLHVRFRPDSKSLAIDGSWLMPPRQADQSSWSFFLSPTMSNLRITRLACGKSAIPVTSLTSAPSGGDTAWTITSTGHCGAATPLRMSFAYESLRGAPQLQVSEDSAFAGGFGEIWYPQADFKILDTAQIQLEAPREFSGIATGRLIRSHTKRGMRVSTYLITRPAKLAFAIGRYLTGGTSQPFPTRLLAMPPASGLHSKAIELSHLLAPLEVAFGPAPERPLSLVEVRFGKSVAGTSEFGMIFALHAQITGPFDPAYWAHEFSHQWWGIAIRPTAKTPGAVLLTEGMAQYGALLALEATQGRAAVAHYRWADKRDSILGYLRFLARGDDRPLVGTPPSTDDEVLRLHNMATSKGAILLSQLEWIVGCARFHALLQSFFRAHQETTVAWQDLEDEIRAGTAHRFDWWFEQWLHQGGAPSFDVSPRIDGRDIIVRVTQRTPSLWRLIIPLRACEAAGEENFSIDTTEHDKVIRLHARTAVSSVLIDPDALIPNLQARNLPEPRHSCP